jgi:hypothetical protein
MTSQFELSKFRIEKARIRATLALATGQVVHGCFFAASASTRGVGPERIGDVLNAEGGFFPFEVHEDGATRTVLYNRNQLVTVSLDDNEAVRDPGYDVAAPRLVELALTDGRRVAGTVRVYRPEGRNRLSDWTRQPEPFRYLEGDAGTLLVNMAHVIEVSEIA